MLKQKIKKRLIKSFIKGMGSINLFPPPIRLEDINPNYSPKYSVDVQNARAIADDWKQVGQDLDEVMKKFKEQYIK